MRPDGASVVFGPFAETKGPRPQWRKNTEQWMELNWNDYKSLCTITKLFSSVEQRCTPHVAAYVLPIGRNTKRSLSEPTCLSPLP